jgi:hypothetical protein
MPGLAKASDGADFEVRTIMGAGTSANLETIGYAVKGALRRPISA